MSAFRRSARTIVAVASAAALTLLGSGVALAAPGDVDTGFGVGGSITVPLGGSADVGGLVRRDDGSFIVGASVDTSFVTVAITQGGDLLDTYGSGGISSIPIPGAADATVTDVALQPNGRVVLAGYDSAKLGSRFVIARFRAGGAPDDSFSGDGVLTTAFPQGDAYGYGVTVQHDGRIVVVGEVDALPNVSNPGIIRLDPDGSLDRSFGDHGRKMVKVPDGVQGYDSPWRVVEQSDGKLAMAGWAEREGGNYKTLALRLKSTGGLDTTFSGDGAAIVDVDGLDNYAYGLAKDGQKLVLGVHTSASDAGFVRLDDNGHRDSSFSGDGVATHTLSLPWEVAAVRVLSDHRIVGVSDYTGGPNVVQLKAGGSLDQSFGTGGEAGGPVKGAQGEDLVITPNGKIVVAGRTGSDVLAVRFLGS